MLGNPVPRPPNAQNFSVFAGDFLDGEGARIAHNKYHKGKFHEYSNLRSHISYLYDMIIRQFCCLHSVTLGENVCRTLAFNLLELINIYKYMQERLVDIS